MATDDVVRIAKHAGLNEPAPLLAALVALDGPADAVAEVLRRHHLIGLVRSTVADAELRARVPRDLAEALLGRRPIGRVPVARMLAVFAEVDRALAADGVPTLLLKGFHFAARLYGGAGRRPQHDVDLLVRSGDFRRAVRVLRRLGFVSKARDLHALSLRRDDVTIDLHRHLRWAPAYALDEAAIWASAAEVRVDGVGMRTPSDEYTLVLLATSACEDLGQGSAKMKQLLDVYLLLRQLDASTDWEAFLARRARENLLGVVVNVLAIVIEVFAAAGEVPRLAAVLAVHRDACVLGGRDEILELVFAPPKNDASLEWFGRVYPGSMPHYLLWFWYGGFPANAGRAVPALRSALRLAWGRRQAVP